MKKQIHKRLSNEQVINILSKYKRKEITAKQAYTYLGISRSRLYQLVESFLENSEDFNIEYVRNKPTHAISSKTEQYILEELKIEKEKVINNPDVPVNRYNYSYIQSIIKDKYDIDVSVPTIISRAKQHGFWKSRPKKVIHDREVITNYVGELIQHDSSHHLFAPNAQEKWYLITSLDDHSRALLHAKLWKKESTWAHITALEDLCSVNGFPFSYYADQHSIFRYVKERDKHSPWYTARKFTDDVSPQWKQVLDDCGIEIKYALSPQAKGKIERPYRWLQDHLVRTCLRKNIVHIDQAQKILEQEVFNYNYKRIHSTTGEIPMIRFENALKNNNSLFCPFSIRKPFISTRDIFCLRMSRIVDAYRNISLHGFKIKVPGVPPREKVELRMYPEIDTQLIEIRFWYDFKLTGTQKIKFSDFPTVQF